MCARRELMQPGIWCVYCTTQRMQSIQVDEMLNACCSMFIADPEELYDVTNIPRFLLVCFDIRCEKPFHARP